MTRAFLDSNVLIYSVGEGTHADKAMALVGSRCVISAQCLNEFASVARRKLGWTWPDIEQASLRFGTLCDEVVVVDLDVHRQGLALAQRYNLLIYDAMIVAAALTAGCDVLYSEDMHAGLVVDGRLTIVNPFA